MRGISRLRRRSLGVAAALGLGLASAAVAVPSASAAQAASPRITFYFGLRRPEAKARQAFFAVQQPGSSSYRRFLTPRQVATRYGASASIRTRFVRDIRRYGFSVRVDPSGVFARVSGTVALFQRVFKVRITQGMGDNPPVMTYGTTKPLRLPSDLRPLVEDVVTSYLRQVKVSAAHTMSAHAVPARALAAPVASGGPARTGTWTGGCAQAEATGAFSYDQVRDAYGIDGPKVSTTLHFLKQFLWLRGLDRKV